MFFLINFSSSLNYSFIYHRRRAFHEHFQSIVRSNSATTYQDLLPYINAIVCDESRLSQTDVNYCPERYNCRREQLLFTVSFRKYLKEMNAVNAMIGSILHDPKVPQLREILSRTVLEAIDTPAPP